MDKLSKEQQAELKSTFQLFDKNGDGSISSQELESAMRALGQKPTQAEVQELIKNADLDGNGKISFSEFVVMMTRDSDTGGVSSRESELKAAFSVFDKDGDGIITTKEVFQALTNLGERLTQSEIEEMIREADKDSDGKISYDEFARMMTTNHHK
ncbi:hypothetical protein B0O80DRAFT_386184 [Mortierella sp. GBAus27b]|nr:hypothetical protein B0O80DRAFT_386184 [Mortierella sp. GBAus27b]